MARASIRRSPRGALYDLLTFERLTTGPTTHLIYWAGLGLIALIGFGVVGGAIGVAFRGGSLEGALLSLPVLVGGLLLCLVLGLLWRGACEFYLAVFSIADDLRALRQAIEREEAAANAAAAAAAPPMTAPPPRPPPRALEG
jgi:hypothetical protein